MKVTYKMIAKDMRLSGTFLKYVVRLNSEKNFKRIQYLLEKTIKGKKIKNPNIISTEEFITGRDGKNIRLCIYSPKNLDVSSPVTGLLWIHGGGYAVGLPEIEQPTIEKLMLTSNTVVISPDYRLSIDGPFPAALEDCYDTLLWMKHNAKELGILENQLFVGGESAGGGLTCCLSAYARDKGDVNIAYQIPLYPMLDDRMQTNSMINNNAPIWNERNNIAAWKLYLGEDYQTNNVSPYAAPARLTSFKDLPPTFTFVGSIDPFCDETKTYIENLKQANIPTTFKIYDGAFHSFDRFAPLSRQAKEATQFMLDNYKMATTTYFKEQDKTEK